MNKLQIFAEKYYQGMNVAAKYSKSQIRSINYFIDFLRDNELNIQYVTPKDANDFVELLKMLPSRRGGTLSNSRINDIINAVEVGYREAVKHEELMMNPFGSIKRLPIDKMTNAYGSMVLDIEDVARLFEACETQRERIVLHLFYSVAARRSEAGRIKIEHINFSKNEIQIDGKKDSNGNERIRIVPIPPTIMEEIKEYIYTEREEVLRNRESDYLIISSRSLKNSGGVSFRPFRCEF